MREVVVPNRQAKVFWVVWGTAFAFKLSLIMTLAVMSRPTRDANLERAHRLEQAARARAERTVVRIGPRGAISQELAYDLNCYP